MYYYVVLSMYNDVKVAETKINDAAAKNAPGPGPSGGSRTTLGVPRRAQGTLCKALLMHSLEVCSFM